MTTCGSFLFEYAFNPHKIYYAVVNVVSIVPNFESAHLQTSASPCPDIALQRPAEALLHKDLWSEMSGKSFEAIGGCQASLRVEQRCETEITEDGAMSTSHENIVL